MIKEAIYEVVNKRDLPYETAKSVMNEIMSGEATQAQMGAFLTALRMKGETIDEITACAEVMREKALKLNPGLPVMDIVGTGGDEVGTFNISTTSMFVVAAGGVPVAKHGNRSVSSKSGAADVLEQLGINLNLTPAQSEELLKKTSLCFMFAQAYHSSMKYAGPVRREIGIRTIFNILGPLSNPANATMQLLGVYDPALVEPLAKVLQNLGVVRGLVVCGGDGLDEITATGKTQVCEIRYKNIVKYEITPSDYGFKERTLSELIGGSPADNAQITKDILSGKEQGAKRDVVVLNAGFALYLGKDDCTVEECIHLADELIQSGKAYEKLEEFVRMSKEVTAL